MKYDVENRRIWFKGEILNVNDLLHKKTPHGFITLITRVYWRSILIKETRLF